MFALSLPLLFPLPLPLPLSLPLPLQFSPPLAAGFVGLSWVDVCQCASASSLLGRASTSAYGFVGALLFRIGGVDTSGGVDPFGRIVLEIRNKEQGNVLRYGEGRGRGCKDGVCG